VQKETVTITLPEKISIQNLSDTLRRIEKRGKKSNYYLDFKYVKDYDTSGIAFLCFVKTKYKNVVFMNITEDIHDAIARFPSEVLPSTHSDDTFPSSSWVELLADRFLNSMDSLRKFFVLLADEFFHIVSFLRKRRGVYPGEILNQFYFMSYKSFPIVCLITFLVGVTISLTSAAQLRLFGADIYLSYLIGIAMIRELVPLMTGIILSGKIGAAITAEISTMKVLEEIDALKTMGIIPE
jgi:phospholipid/cholesterol/gamma-HCH transport system permease protein